MQAEMQACELSLLLFLFFISTLETPREVEDCWSSPSYRRVFSLKKKEGVQICLLQAQLDAGFPPVAPAWLRSAGRKGNISLLGLFP